MWQNGKKKQENQESRENEPHNLEDSEYCRIFAEKSETSRKKQNNESSRTESQPRQRHHRGNHQKPDRTRIPRPPGHLRRGYERRC